MSTEFCRGPTIYLRETSPSDLVAFTEALSDWETFPLSTERVKTYMLGLFTSYRAIIRPYTNENSFRELVTICRVSDNEPIGLNQWTLLPNKHIEVNHIAIRPDYRGQGYRNEAVIIRDAIFYDVFQINSVKTMIDSPYLSPKDYQTVTETATSNRNGRVRKSLHSTLESWNTWKANNSTSIPSYTYSGNDYVAPHLRD
jgi:hypothetical protein